MFDKLPIPRRSRTTSTDTISSSSSSLHMPSFLNQNAHPLHDIERHHSPTRHLTVSESQWGDPRGTWVVHVVDIHRRGRLVKKVIVERKKDGRESVAVVRYDERGEEIRGHEQVWTGGQLGLGWEASAGVRWEDWIEDEEKPRRQGTNSSL